MCKYVLKPRGKGSANHKNLRRIWYAIEGNRKEIKKEYKARTGVVLELGRFFCRPRSVLMMIGPETNLNILSDILINVFHNENINCSVPYWG